MWSLDTCVAARRPEGPADKRSMWGCNDNVCFLVESESLFPLVSCPYALICYVCEICPTDCSSELGVHQLSILLSSQPSLHPSASPIALQRDDPANGVLGNDGSLRLEVARRQVGVNRGMSDEQIVPYSRPRCRGRKCWYRRSSGPITAVLA